MDKPVKMKKKPCFFGWCKKPCLFVVFLPSLMGKWKLIRLFFLYGSKKKRKGKMEILPWPNTMTIKKKKTSLLLSRVSIKYDSSSVLCTERLTEQRKRKSWSFRLSVSATAPFFERYRNQSLFLRFRAMALSPWLSWSFCMVKFLFCS